VKHCFHLVIGRMCHGDKSRADPLGRLKQEIVAERSGGGFPAIPGIRHAGRPIRLPDGELDFQLRA
jgi:hypothetical protein